MKNKVVYLQFKGSTETYTFTGVSSLFKKFDKEDTGISRGSLCEVVSLTIPSLFDTGFS